MQVSRLVSLMKEESKGGSESHTRIQLRNKIAALPQSQLARATDALSMIWDGITGSLDLPAPGPKSISSANSTSFSKWQRMIFLLSSNRERMKLALLKSIPTGTFIDVQFYAYNAISGDLPLDLNPVFTSSIVIEEWAAAITTRELKGSSPFSTLTRDKETAGINSEPARLMDGLADDYEYWDEGLTENPHKDKPIPYAPRSSHSGVERAHVLFRKHHTEVATNAEGSEVVVLMSGAWRTWVIFNRSQDEGPMRF